MVGKEACLLLHSRKNLEQMPNEHYCPDDPNNNSGKFHIFSVFTRARPLVSKTLTISQIVNQFAIRAFAHRKAARRHRAPR